MIGEIDTTQDFSYYLTDRRNYLKIADIPLDQEMNALGCYKSAINKFPKIDADLRANNYWAEYRSKMKEEIEVREFHNNFSKWVDKIEALFTTQRKLHDGIPLGMYFSWEFGSMARRVRSYLGEMIDKVQDWFATGKQSRQFCFQNPSSGNWIVLYYSTEKNDTIQSRLSRLMELKLVKESHLRGFDFGVYGLAFKVSSKIPQQLLGVVGTGFMGVDENLKLSIPDNIEEAFSTWGKDEGRKMILIEEFPTK